MHALTPLLQTGSYPTTRLIDRFQDFDLALPHREKGDANTLLRDLFDPCQRQTQDVLIKGNHFLQIMRNDTDMIDSFDFHGLPPSSSQNSYRTVLSKNVSEGITDLS